MYKVIWIDDEYHLNESFSELAKEVYSIELIPFKLRKEGMSEFERRPNHYDGVILDARMLDESSDEIPDTDGLYKALFKLRAVQEVNYFPIVIFSANRNDILDEEQFKKVTKDIPVYKKSIDENRILSELREMIKQNPIAKIKYENKEALELCTSKYIGSEYYDNFLQLLKILNGLEKSSSQKPLTPIRKILEGVFQKLVSIGILPQEFKGKLNESCNVITNKDQSYFHTKKIFDPLIQHILKSILPIVQDEQHLRDDLRLHVDQYISKQATNNVLYGLTYLLIDLMIWFKKLFDEHTDRELNQTYLKPNIGIIEADSSGHTFCINESGKYLLQRSYGKVTYSLNDTLRIKEWKPNTDERTKRIYNRFVTKIEVINKSSY
jgi:hypothetical protein